MANQNEQQDLTIQVPITLAMRQQASALAQEQPTSEMAARVERNILAVLAVHTYLQWQGYVTDLSEGSYWHPGTRLAGGDVADLMIVNLGRVECRPVSADQETWALPPEVWHNRIGYVMVQLEAEARQAVLLGFIPALDPEDPLEEVALTDLQSMDQWIDYLDRLEKAAGFINADPSPEAEQVRQMWADDHSRLMLVAQLERIYRSESPNKWRVKGEKMLSGRVLEGVVVREEAMPTDRIELQGVAERLLKRLATVWNEIED